MNYKSCAVKALIYRRDGKILMQQRDNDIRINNPNKWTFFGGMVEKGESLKEALSRELLEEICILPGAIQEPLFKWFSTEDKVENYCFPIKFDVSDNDLRLIEGRDMQWLTLAEVIARETTSIVYHNLSYLLTFISQLVPGQIQLVEEALLSKKKLKKKNDRVFYAKDSPISLTLQDIYFLKGLAQAKKNDIFRVCLHSNDNEIIHEMVMVHTQPTQVGPLKQNNRQSLSYYMIEGKLAVSFYTDDGKKYEQILLDASNQSENKIIRLEPQIFRSVKSLSAYAIFVEIAQGPFNDNDTIWMR